jgi:hypothetical protein
MFLTATVTTNEARVLSRAQFFCKLFWDDVTAEVTVAKFLRHASISRLV